MLQLQLAKRYFDMYGVLITVSSRQNGKIYRSQISASGFHIGILGPQVFPVHGWLIFQKRCLAKSRDLFFFSFLLTRWRVLAAGLITARPFLMMMIIEDDDKRCEVNKKGSKLLPITTTAFGFFVAAKIDYRIAILFLSCLHSLLYQARVVNF